MAEAAVATAISTPATLAYYALFRTQLGWGTGGRHRHLGAVLESSS